MKTYIKLIVPVVLLFSCLAFAGTFNEFPNTPIPGSGSGGWTLATDCSSTITNGAGCWNGSVFCIGNGSSCVNTGAGGAVSASGTPANHYWGIWTGASAIKGVSVGANAPVCTGSTDEPVSCTNLIDVAYLPLHSTADLAAGLSGSPNITVGVINATSLTGAAISDSVSTPSSTTAASTTAVKSVQDSKQATLVSGTSIKTIGGQSVLGSGNLTIGGVSGVDWAPITDFTAGTASTSVIPMTADHTADCPKGSMLQLMINSVLQYAGVANITSNALTIFGVPLSTSYPITALKCAPGRMYHDNYLLGGNYEAASTNTAINDVNGGYMVWGESPAVLLGFSIYAIGADTGTAPSVNMMINGNPVFTSDLTVTAAGTLYSSVVTANATNCTITYGDTWEVKVTKNGNGDGTSLTVIPKWGKL